MTGFFEIRVENLEPRKDKKKTSAATKKKKQEILQEHEEG